jgi:molybdenum cofactor biosynthesis enzyme
MSSSSDHHNEKRSATEVLTALSSTAVGAKALYDMKKDVDKKKGGKKK